MHARLITSTLLIALFAGGSAGAKVSAPVAPMEMSPRSPAMTTDGITIFSNGTATAAADSAFVSINVNGPTLSRDTLQRIADAMVQAGMERDSIQIPPYMQYPGTRTTFAQLSGTVRQPTPEKMRAAIPIIGAAFMRENLSIPNAIIRFHVDDCAPLIERAQAQAVRSARSQAERLAKAAGVRIGALDGLTANANGAPGCDTMTFLPVQGGGEQQDPTKDMTVHVNAAVTAHFSILR